MRSSAAWFNRSWFRVAAAAVCAGGVFALVGSSAARAAGGKPNILFIMGDDIGWMQPVSITAG
jgi:hypothetical protein